MPGLCAFTEPVFLADGQLVLQWELVFGETTLGVYQRTGPGQWCLLAKLWHEFRCGG